MIDPFEIEIALLQMVAFCCFALGIGNFAQFIFWHRDRSINRAALHLVGSLAAFSGFAIAVLLFVQTLETDVSQL